MTSENPPNSELVERFRIISDLISYFAYLFHLTPDGAMTLEWVTDSLRRVTDYTREEINTQGWQCLIYPDDLHLAQAQLSQVKDGENSIAEFRIQGRHGQVRWIRNYLRPMPDDQGQPTRVYGAAVDITESKRAEEEKNRIERDYIDFIENAAVGLHWVGADGTILWANQAELDLLGYTRDEYVGRHIAEIHADQSVINDILYRLSNKQTLQDYAARLKHKDGSIRHVLITSNVRWDKERFLHTRCFTRDVTESRKVEQERSLLASIVESSDDAILSIDLDGTILSWNKGAERLYGYKADEVIGQSVSMLMPLKRAEDFPMIMSTLRQGERVNHYETERQHKDGRIIQVSLAVSPIENAAGEVVGAAAIARDITQRRQLEDERAQLLVREQAARNEAEQAQKRIARALAQAKTAHAAAQDAIEKQRLVQERLTYLVDASAALLSTLQVETILPMIIETAKQVVNADAYAVWRYTTSSRLWRVMASAGLSGDYIKNTGSILIGTTPLMIPTVIAEDVTTEDRLQTRLEAYEAEGIKSILVVPLNINGENAGTVGFYFKQKHSFEETEVRVATALANLAAAAIGTAELYSEQRRLREEAEKASRAKDEFLAMVSHELRTPLNAIVGWTVILRMGMTDEQTKASALEVIERNAKSQKKLIEDLLDISRIVSGKLRLNVQPVEPSSVVEAAIDVIRPAAAAKEIRLQIVLDPSVGLISGDPERLQQVIWNLLSNAIKFTPKKGRVQVRLQRLNSHVEITVSDTGDGISPEFLPYVFDRFLQADSSFTRRHGGLGLGLAIARHLIELHGGEISAASDGKGQGATFTVKLPVMIVHASTLYQTGLRKKEEGVAPAASPIDCPQSLPGMRLLVVEDEPDARELLKVILEQCGAEVTAAQSAKEALERLEGSIPDLIISDIEMPEEDGYSFIQKVRAGEPAHQHLPAIALTAHTRVEDRLKALKAGYDAHVAKPVELNELIIVIESLARRTGNL
jgi:PAS domain S-box-containing protein